VNIGGTMKTVSMRRTIAAPIDEVFDWLVDGTNWASVPGMIYSTRRGIDNFAGSSGRYRSILDIDIPVKGSCAF
jgi:hypothetical protein